MEGNWSYSFSNPADTQKTESKYHTESCGKDCTKTVADPVAPTANPDGPKPYTITVTLNNGYGWSDGTFESKNIFIIA